MKPELKIIGGDGNAFALLAAARRVALKNKMDWDVIEKEATSGDYDHLLATLANHFKIS